jgi:protein gp37
MARRLQAMGQPNYKKGFQVALHEKVLEYPLKWKKPQNIFVNSMSDLFHEKVPVDFILKTFETMNLAYWHRFQILTKRAERLYQLNPNLPWSDNIWMGVSVENHKYKKRIDYLRQTGAKVKFVSFEPLIGNIGKINLKKIDWIIVGGESGPNARPMKKEWITDIRDQCLKTGVAFFFKQWGGCNKKKSGRMLDGRTWSELPSSTGISI